MRPLGTRQNPLFLQGRSDLTIGTRIALQHRGVSATLSEVWHAWNPFTARTSLDISSASGP